MLRDEVTKYTELTGEDGNHTPIMKIGAYLDGYEKGLSVQSVSRWIPTSEKLPEEGILVLTSLREGYGDYRIVLQKADVKKWWWKEGVVEAWMPLPEPYKESEGE